MNAVAASLVVLILAVADPPGRESAAELLVLGNGSLREGDAEKAAELFGRAGQAATPAKAAATRAERTLAAQAAYNEGCARMALGQLPEAEDLFRRADDATDDPSLAASARFNLGLARYTRAMADPKKDPAAAIGTLRSAAAAFQAAVRADASDESAARALEITRRQIKKLRDQQEQQRQKQRQQQQKKQQSADKLKELAQRQQELAEQSKQAARSQQDEASEAAESERIEAEQSQLNEETAKAMEGLQPQPGDQDAEEAAGHLRRAMEHQREASESLDQARPDRAETDQKDAAENLHRAANALGRSAQQGEGGEPSEDNPQPKQEEQQSQAQAKQDPAVSQLLDKEQREREARERRRRQAIGGIQPVEKDW